ncbi:nucleophile aminohydrolase [Geranomyces variabilis]|nr:nucleophile aminohydrolase [Geranomyces variabilis]
MSSPAQPYSPETPHAQRGSYDNDDTTLLIGEDSGQRLAHSTRSAPSPSSPWTRLNTMLRGRARRTLAFAALTLLIIWAVVAVGRQGNKGPFTPCPVGAVQAKKGAVSSEHPICSQIGVDVLKEGGSAVDATIATGLCIGVTNMYSSGIGGGGFMVVRDANGGSSFIDFREEAPTAASRDMYNDDPRKAQFGGTGFGVPGEIRGFEAAYKKYGKLPWARLFQPAIDLCMNGWEVNAVLEQRINLVPDLMLKDANFRAIFAPNGVLLKTGDTIKRETYGKALSAIAAKGADVFYSGWIADELVKTARADGGVITLDDMKNYQAKVEPTLIGFYHGRRIITAPPPTSGPVLLSILNVMEGYHLHSEGRTATNIHRLIEAYKHGFAERSYYGDPIDTTYTNISAIAAEFAEKTSAWNVRRLILDNQTFPVEHYNPVFDVKEDHGTMHVSVLTDSGEAVSMTSTVNLLFGGQIMDPVTGIILNDEMDDFSIPNHPNAFGLAPSPYNYIQPKKRPLSSSVPTIVENGDYVEAVIGASGGSRIITAVAQALLDMLSWDADAATAVRQPRAHHQLLPNTLFVEYEYDRKLIAELEKRGHQVTVFAKGLYLSGVEAIKRTADGTIQAASDWRKGGASVGY